MPAKRICLFSAALPGSDPREVVDAALAAGLGAVEWAVGPQQPITTPHQGAELLDLQRKHDLTVPCVTVQDTFASLLRPETLEPFMALAAGLGAPYVRVFAPRYEGGVLADEFARAQTGARAAAELAHRHGLAVLVETCPETLVPSTAQARALFRGCRHTDTGTLYDPGNMIIEGHIAPALAIAELGPALRHVHVKNIAWDRTDRGWEWRHAKLSEGLLDWREIMTRLRDAGYGGWLSLDHLAGDTSGVAIGREIDLLRGMQLP